MLDSIRKRFWNSSGDFDPQTYFTVPLFDLRETSPQFAGILAPEPERGAEKVGITEQFLENAAAFHERYADSERAVRGAPHFRYMDDKWLFSRSYMRETARQAGFREVVFVSASAKDRQFTDETERLLRLHSGLAASALPDWAWSIVNLLDDTLGDELKDELLLAAVSVFRR